MSSEKITIEVEILKQVFSDLNALRKSFGETNAAVQALEKNVSGGMNNVDKAVHNATDGAANMAKELARLRPIDVTAVANSFSGLNDSIKSAIEPGAAFDQSLHEMSAVTGVTGAALDDLGDRARALAKAYGSDAAASVDTFKVLVGQLGPALATQPAVLDEMARKATILGKTMGGDTVSAARALSTIMSQYKVNTNDAAEATKATTRIVNVLAAAAKEGGAEVPALAAAMEQAGAAAKGGGVDMETAAASLEYLDKAGKKGAEGGVALRNVLMILGKGRFLEEKSADALTKAGIDVAKLGDNSTSFTQRLRMLKPVLKDTALMSQLFGSENSQAGISLVQYADDIEETAKKITGTNEAQEQAAIVMDSYNEKLSRWKARLSDIGITIFGGAKYFSPFLDAGLSGVQLLANLRNAQEGFSMVMDTRFGAALKKGASWVMALGRAETWSAWATGISTAAKSAWAALMNTRVMTAIAGSVTALRGMTLGQMASAAMTGLATAATTAWTTATTALTTAFKANPIMFIVGLVAALVGAVIYAWNHFEGFRAFLYGFWEAAKEVFSSVWEVVKTAFSGIIEMAKGLGGVLGGVWDMASGNWSEGWEKLKGGAEQFGMGLVDNFTAPFRAIGTATKEANTLGMRVGMAYAKGDAEGRKSFQADQALKAAENPVAAPTYQGYDFERQKLPVGVLNRDALAKAAGTGQGAATAVLWDPLDAMRGKEPVTAYSALDAHVDPFVADYDTTGKGKKRKTAGAGADGGGVSVGGSGGGGDHIITMNIEMKNSFSIGRNVVESAQAAADKVVSQLVSKLNDSQFAIG